MTARSPLRIAALAAAAATLPLIAGCSSLGLGGGPSETGYVARDAESLYSAAKERLDRGDVKDYNKAIESAQRFLQIHPGNKDAPYAYYLIALSYYEQINDVDRDQQITLRALDALNDVNRRYPESEYAADARVKIDLVNDHLAGK